MWSDGTSVSLKVMFDWPVQVRIRCGQMSHLLVSRLCSTDLSGNKNQGHLSDFQGSKLIMI